MAEQNQEDPSRSSHEFVESSILDTLIPHATNFDIEEALSDSVERLDDAAASPISAIAQRNFIFFDEEIDVYIILQTPYSDERTLRTYLGRLVVTLEAQAQSPPLSHDGPPSRENIYSQPIKDIQDPIIVVQGPDDGRERSKDGHILLIWKVPAARVSRPRMRIGATTAVVFSASAFLKPAEQGDSNSREDEYLPSLIPSGINLLESFGQDSLGGSKPHLSAFRVSRMIPSTDTGRDLMRHFKNISRRSFKAFPALGTRIKYSRPNVIPNSQVMIASLDIDIVPVSGCDIILEDIVFTMSSGATENLNEAHGLNLPSKCLPLDNMTFLYRLSPNENEWARDPSIKSHLRALDVLIKATAIVSENCKPQITMTWKTTIDFTIPVNPGYGQPSQNLQRTRRPTNLSIDSFDGVSTTGPLRLDLPSVESTHHRSSSTPDFGITITFSGPDYCTPGEIFTWNAFVVNRSTKPRKLVLIVIPKRKRGELRFNRPPSIGRGSDSIADAVIDENIVHVMQKTATLDAAGIICLSADLKVGPLPPLACHTIDIRMMTLITGVLDLEAVRVIDMGTNEHVDIHDLPTIVSVSKESNLVS